MALLIFRTNIENEKKREKLEQQLSGLTPISSWTLDVEDVDNVLKVHTLSLSQYEVQSVIRESGFMCEELF